MFSFLCVIITFKNCIGVGDEANLLHDHEYSFMHPRQIRNLLLLHCQSVDK